ncbi:hypothetical protein OIU84_004839, partial [Salix udensis]
MWGIWSSAFFLLFHLVVRVSGNAEGDALNALRTNLLDPGDVLQSWDPTLVNPCTWFHVTCNSENSVTRVDLGNANLTGQLVTQLGNLPNLQYFGPIPKTLDRLQKLRFLRLNNNTLRGTIPMNLTTITSLQVLDLSNNKLTGDIPVNGSFSLFTPISFANNNLNPLPVSPPSQIPTTGSPSNGN